MPEKHLVSVVVPCLNRAHLLEPTVESILAQSYPRIECIVVDGGSTDRTIDILKKYDNHIKWVSEKDRGHADAINKGWNMSRGDILAWLNADDVWAVPNAVEIAVVYLQDNPDVDVVFGDCGSIDASGKQVGMSYLHEWDLDYAVEFNDHCIPQPASFLRRKILDRVGFLDERFYAMDKELWLRIGLQGKITHIPRLLAHARNTPGKIHNGQRMAQDCVEIIQHFYSLPNISEQLRSRKKRAISNSYLRGISYALECGPHWCTILRFAYMAIVADPTNIRQLLYRLSRRFLTSHGAEPKSID
jgi:glycosyltransferase involved in cell wall biosynthesis